MSEPTPDVTTTDLLGQEHEQVVFCRDEASGLRAIVALHSTTLGPGLGGTRFFPYRSESEAVADVLDLSRGMTYKNALAGLDHGGGKAVIWGNPGTDKTETLLRAYGRFVESLGGRYVTACDVGTYSPDMDVVARESRHVTGRTEAEGGAGDSSRLTAFGVHQGLRAAAAFRWGSDSLAGRTIGISGVGKVGRLLTGLLLDDDADVVVADVDAAALADVQDRHPGVRVAGSTAELVAEPLDVYAPCALGHALTDDVVRSIAGAVVCGGANNQLAHAGTASLLAEADVLYAPDFCVNAGGVIQVADELHPAGPDFDRARARAAGIFETTLTVLELAASERTTTAAAAERLAERRIADVSWLQRIWL